LEMIKRKISTCVVSAGSGSRYTPLLLLFFHHFT
jgi:hypothetical protein